MKKLLILLLLFSSGCTNELRRNGYWFLRIRPEAGCGGGTATIVKGDYLVTAAHVAPKEGLKPHIEDEYGRTYSYRIIREHRYDFMDVVVFRVVGLPEHLKRWEVAEPAAGARCASMGFYRPKMSVESNGYVEMHQGCTITTTTMPVPGNSGGPLVQHGKLIGITTAYRYKCDGSIGGVHSNIWLIFGRNWVD